MTIYLIRPGNCSKIVVVIGNIYMFFAKGVCIIVFISEGLCLIFVLAVNHGEIKRDTIII